MCRFLIYLGPKIGLHKLVTDPTNSLIEQSIHAKHRREPLNGDGFGLAFYLPEVSEEPAQFRSIQPAWNNVNLRQLCRVMHSSVVLAHVRAATHELPVAEVNCHPFVGRRYSFMHNGQIGGFRRLKRRLQQRMSDESFDALQGSTDSEHAFALFKDRLEENGHDGPAALEAAMLETIGEIESLRAAHAPDEESHLNFAVSDGRSAVITRYSTDPARIASLFFDVGRVYECEGGVCRMVPNRNGETGATIVASEPLSEDGGWEEVPPQHMVLVHPDRSVELKPIVL